MLLVKGGHMYKKKDVTGKLAEALKRNLFKELYNYIST